MNRASSVGIYYNQQTHSEYRNSTYYNSLSV
jgi:hypothetical protein